VRFRFQPTPINCVLGFAEQAAFRRMERKV